MPEKNLTNTIPYFIVKKVAVQAAVPKTVGAGYGRMDTVFWDVPLP